jgi:PD-(D/E)XK nuclease superfamily protein
MISNPTSKGKTSEAVILAALVKLGKSVLIPWGEERYDLALDEGGRLVRIQCKTGHIRDGCVCFKRASPTRGGHWETAATPGRLMRSLSTARKSNGYTWVPIEAVRTTIGARLRLEPAKNGQTWNIRWAREFELASGA